MTPREQHELQNNREGLWEMYRIVNPPLGLVETVIPAGHWLWLENGRMHIATNDHEPVAMWVTFRIGAPAEISVTAADAQELTPYLLAGQLEVHEAWLDGEPTNHRNFAAPDD